MKTFSIRAGEIKNNWYVVNLEGKVLGRAATEIARRLMGKHKPQYSRHLDVGDFIVVTNAERVQVTGKKEEDKVYYRHSGYIGGLTATHLKDMRSTHPIRIIETAVRGMLPKNALGRAMFRKLKVYVGPEHPHQAQQPEPLEL